MKYKFAIISTIVAVIIILAAYAFVTSSSAAETVAIGDNVSIYYSGSFTNGTVFNSNFGGTPFNFTVGANQVIPGFDNAVIGMKLNQNKTVTIPMNEAYGPINPNLIVRVPIKDLNNQSVKAGMLLTETTTTGQSLQGRVLSVNSTNATIDFNAPLAGYTLVFTIKVLRISK
jgi:peptidylprolyl isomerase